MLRNYLLMAFRVLVRRKFFAFASLFGVSFTLVVMIVAVSFLDQSFAPHAPQSDSDRMLFVERMRLAGEGSISISSPGFAFLEDATADLPGVENVSLYSNGSGETLYRDGDKHTFQVRYTDGAYWQIFDFTFLHGSAFSSEDEANGLPVVIVTRKLARKIFDRDDVLGEQLAFDGLTFEVIGVVEDVSAVRDATFSDAWIPARSARSQSYRNNYIGDYHAVLLASDRAQIPSIKAEFERRVQESVVPPPRSEWVEEKTCYALTIFEGISAEFSDQGLEPRPTLFRTYIISAFLLFMLLPALNMMNLNLSRVLERSAEIGVRRAFGAKRSSLLTQFLFENVVLTVMGGLLGFALSVWVIYLINAADIEGAIFALSGRVFLWGMLLSVIFGVVSGLYPAWRLSRMPPVECLRAKAR